MRSIELKSSNYRYSSLFLKRAYRALYRTETPATWHWSPLLPEEAPEKYKIQYAEVEDEIVLN